MANDRVCLRCGRPATVAVDIHHGTVFSCDADRAEVAKDHMKATGRGAVTIVPLNEATEGDEGAS